MSIDTPIRLLEAIVDEVEGLRRTDARSFLPEPLLRRARAALEPAQPTTGQGGAHLTTFDDLEGHTIAHVFDCGLKRSELVLVTADGSFIAFDIDTDDEDASLSATGRRYTGGGGFQLTDFVLPRELANAGLLSTEDKARIEREAQEKKIAEAKRRVAAAQTALQTAERELAAMQPKETADAAPAA
jgi:hypothetical protein